MCGLTGFWHFRATESEQEVSERVRRMADTLTHRGPDDWGAWVDPAVGIAFGFRRLSVIDLTPSGHQPMLSEDNRWVIMFNGEIYNYRDLRIELEQCGFRFRGTSDTEVILAACSAWGAQTAIPRLWGMFAITLWDRKEGILLLARDRLGKKPLYYTQMGHVFMFGSELKALKAHPAFKGEIDRDALTLYSRYGYIPAPYCIYQNVRKLPPGHYAVVTNGMAPRLHCYWNAREMVETGLTNPVSFSDIEAVEELDHLLRDAVARRMIADVSLGALLSGGVDSSTVVALMQAQSSRPVKTFSIGFQIADYNEAKWAKAVAQHLGTEHTELYVTPEEAQAVIPQLPDLYDEPFADSSQIPTYLVCELARRYVTVSLSGDGGDELFSGYNRYGQAEKIWTRLRSVPLPVRRMLAKAFHCLRAGSASDRLLRLSPWLSVNNENELYQRFVSLWNEPGELINDGHEPETPWLDSSLSVNLPNFTERMMYLDLVTYLPDDILVKLDRASMGVSLEGRCPLLDHRVVEWVWRLPLALKARDHQRKWLLKQLLYRYVPATLIERPKMGFGIPMDVWLRGPLRDWAESLLDERRLRQEGFFCTELIQHSWDAHLSGRRDEQHRLWVVLMFQAWYERWFKN